ncbi:MAG: type II toxin-antitoxin system PemK/MazF family toxin [Methylotenera sp.]|nr:type II toxin-antitoxin system PemK/MazF family toxin [Methylotenera sp.]
MKAQIQRGQVYWVTLDPVRGSEIAKTRPCVVISANEINRRRNTVAVVPLTSTPEAVHFPLVIDVPSAGKGSKARSEQIRNVDKSRLMRLIGHLSEADLSEISRGVARVLGLG